MPKSPQIKYTEYLAENLNKNINYSQYIAEHVNKNIQYSEYITGTNIGGGGFETKSDIRKRSIKSILDEFELG